MLQGRLYRQGKSHSNSAIHHELRKPNSSVACVRCSRALKRISALEDSSLTRFSCSFSSCPKMSLLHRVRRPSQLTSRVGLRSPKGMHSSLRKPIAGSYFCRHNHVVVVSNCLRTGSTIYRNSLRSFIGCARSGRRLREPITYLRFSWYSHPLRQSRRVHTSQHRPYHRPAWQGLADRSRRNAVPHRVRPRKFVFFHLRKFFSTIQQQPKP